MSHFKWLLPSRLESHPHIWIVQVNGLYMQGDCISPQPI
jgi:hypothetical protein